MNGWTIAVYGIAGLLAVQSVLGLLQAQRRRRVTALFEEELKRREALRAAEEAERQRLPGLDRRVRGAPAETDSMARNTVGADPVRP